LQEIEGAYEEINTQAREHVNHKDIIMTYGKADLLNLFLQAAFIGSKEDSGDK